MHNPETSGRKESPAELRQQAARFRRLATEFPPDMRVVVLEAAAELESTAAKLEAPPAD